MMARDTSTGQVLEAMVLPSLTQGGYTYQKQVDVGRRPNGSKHYIDVLAQKEGRKILISLKWQQVPSSHPLTKLKSNREDKHYDSHPGGVDC